MKTNTTLGTQFVLHARRVQLVEVDERPQTNAFLKFCGNCTEITPHERKANFSECVICQRRTYPHAQQQQLDAD